MNYPPPAFPYVQWDFLSRNKLFSDPRLYFFNRGRSALSFLVQYLLEMDNYFFLIPSYTCPTVASSISAHTDNFTFVDVAENLDFCLDDLHRVVDHIPSRYKIGLVATSLFGVGIRSYKKAFPTFTVIEDRAQWVIDHNSDADYQIGSFGKGKLVSGWSGGVIVTRDKNIEEEYVGLQIESDFWKSFIYTCIQQVVLRYLWFVVDKTFINPEKRKHYVPELMEISRIQEFKRKWITNSMMKFECSRRGDISGFYKKNIRKQFQYALEGKIPLLRYPIKSDMLSNTFYRLSGISLLKGYRTTYEMAKSKRGGDLRGGLQLAYHSAFLPIHELVSDEYMRRVIAIINATS